MVNSVEQLEKLQRQIEHQFKNIALLEEALSHRSVVGKNNERLEFLGDAVLSFVIAEKLYEQFPNANEGELSRYRATLVSGDTLAKLGREHNLSQYIRLGPGEMKSGGHQRDSIIADAVEAIIGAIYFDDGFATCRKSILNWFSKRLQDVATTGLQKDPKTRLQEFMQLKKFPLPKYEVTAIEGAAHAQVFHITCYTTGFSHTSSGKGNSRRRAEQAAAEVYLSMIEKEIK